MNAVLRFEDLAIGYDDQPVVQGITGSLDYGDSLLVIGHNGAGKTTLLRTLFGLLPKLGGSVKLLGEEVAPNSNKKFLQAGVRFLGQGLRSFGGLTVEEHRLVLCRLYGLEKTPEMSEVSQYDISKRVNLLSIGQRRLEALRMLAVGNPNLYLLDEPTAGIDIENCANILGWIDGLRQRKVSYVIVEHNFQQMLRLCDKTMVIRAGKITYFGPSLPLLDDATLGRYFL